MLSLPSTVLAVFGPRLLGDNLQENIVTDLAREAFEQFRKKECISAHINQNKTNKSQSLPSGRGCAKPEIEHTHPRNLEPPIFAPSRYMRSRS